MTDTQLAARLIAIIEGLDLDSADGRAGIHSLLGEIEAAAPGAIEQMADRLELRKVGAGRSTPH